MLFVTANTTCYTRNLASHALAQHVTSHIPSPEICEPLSETRILVLFRMVHHHMGFAQVFTVLGMVLSAPHGEHDAGTR